MEVVICWSFYKFGRLVYFADEFVARNPLRRVCAFFYRGFDKDIFSALCLNIRYIAISGSIKPGDGAGVFDRKVALGRISSRGFF